MGVLYGENVFRAHRVNESNNNAALIRRAKFTIGINSMEDGEMDASGLEKFLQTHPNLKCLKLEFNGHLMEDSKIRDILSDALHSRYSHTLSVLSHHKSTRSYLDEQTFGAATAWKKMVENLNLRKIGRL